MIFNSVVRPTIDRHLFPAFSLRKTRVRKGKARSSKATKLAFICATLLSFTNIAQTISIGSPVDGTEGSSDISFVVSIDSGLVNTSGSAITGFISFAGTASGSIDYIAPTVFMIDDGASATTITVTVIDDPVVEPTETVTGFISSLSAGVVGNAMSTAHIIDDDAAQVTVSIGSPIDALEGTSDVSFEITIIGGAVNNSGMPLTGMINFTGTALDGADYLTPPATFTIPNGAASAQIPVSVIDDLNIEGTETVVATISSLNFGAIGNATSTANIMDDDVANMSVSVHKVQDALEGTSNTIFAVSLDNGFINMTGFSISGTLSVGGTASNGSDFTALDPLTFTIAHAGSADTLFIVVMDDPDFEGTETIELTITSVDLGAIGTAIATADILDDEEDTSGNEEISFETSDVQVITYPNPVNSKLTVKAMEQIQHYSITDLKGKVIDSGKLNQAEVELNLADLREGFYIVTLTLNDGSTVSKKVRKK